MKVKSCKTIPQKPEITIISGATASGKSAYAMDLADRLNAEIINIDSIQVYKYFDIGSAKISLTERQKVPHHLIDIIEPDQEFNVAKYKKLADKAIQNILERKKIPLIVGGSTLYIKALLYGLAELPKGSQELRQELEARPLAELAEELIRLDLEAAANLDLQNPRRVIRALEAIKISGKKLSTIQKEHGFLESDYSGKIILLQPDREVLYQKINARTRAMLENGLIEEVEGIIKKYPLNIKPLTSLGYKETLSFLNKEISFAELEEQLAKNTRHYAKRQMTFWRNEPGKRGWKKNDARDMLVEYEL